MTISSHPIFGINAFQIYTKPIENMVNKLMYHLEKDHHGCYFYGGGRIGKTAATSFLVNYQNSWLGNQGVALRLVMPGSNRKSYSTFWEDFAEGLQIEAPDRLKDKGKLKRIGNALLHKCSLLDVDKVLIFIDNAQTIARNELDWLVELDDYCEAHHFRLFLINIFQNDDMGLDLKTRMSGLPIQIKGRHFMEGYEFKPLSGFVEIQHALSRYDVSASWPDKQTSFTKYFAPSAFSRGWTLSSQTQNIFEEMSKIREKAGLPNNEDFPMMSFTAMVKYLLCDIAGKDPTFNGFSQDDIIRAFKASGFLELELVRCGFRSKEIL